VPSQGSVSVYHAISKGATYDEKARYIFDAIDTDQTGLIDTMELGYLLVQFSLPYSDVTAILKRVDQKTSRGTAGAASAVDVACHGATGGNDNATGDNGNATGGNGNATGGNGNATGDNAIDFDEFRCHFRPLILFQIGELKGKMKEIEHDRLKQTHVQRSLLARSQQLLRRHPPPAKQHPPSPSPSSQPPPTSLFTPSPTRLPATLSTPLPATVNTLPATLSTLPATRPTRPTRLPGANHTRVTVNTRPTRLPGANHTRVAPHAKRHMHMPPSDATGGVCMHMHTRPSDAEGGDEGEGEGGAEGGRTRLGVEVEP